MVKPKDSVAKVAGTPPPTDPSNWQKAFGFFSLLRRTSSFPTRVGLIKHLVHPKSSRAFRATFFSMPGTNSSMSMVTGAIGPLIKGHHRSHGRTSPDFSFQTRCTSRGGEQGQCRHGTGC